MIKHQLPNTIIAELRKIIPKSIRKSNSTTLAIILAFAAGFMLSSLIQPTTTPTADHGVGVSIIGNVTRVIDGDTIVVTANGKEERVRLLGIDAPESDAPNTAECFAGESTRQLTTLIEGATVTLQADPSQQNRDRYDRLLRYVYLPDGTHVNQLLIASGAAFEYTYSTPYFHQDSFIAAETQAREDQIGIWSPENCAEY